MSRTINLYYPKTDADFHMPLYMHRKLGTNLLTQLMRCPINDLSASYTKYQKRLATIF